MLPHWNSLWAPSPGDPPAVDDPSLWRSPWTAEQTIALQARTWETMVSASHSWWNLYLSTSTLSPWLSLNSGKGAEAIAGSQESASSEPAKSKSEETKSHLEADNMEHVRKR